MTKAKVIKNDNGTYHLEVCNDFTSFLTIKIKLSQDELANLYAAMSKYVE